MPTDRGADDGWMTPWPEGTRIHQTQWFDPRAGITPHPVIEIRVHQIPDGETERLVYQLGRQVHDMIRSLAAGDTHDDNES